MFDYLKIYIYFKEIRNELKMGIKKANKAKYMINSK